MIADGKQEVGIGLGAGSSSPLILAVAACYSKTHTHTHTVIPAQQTGRSFHTEMPKTDIPPVSVPLAHVFLNNMEIGFDKPSAWKVEDKLYVFGPVQTAESASLVVVCEK